MNRRNFFKFSAVGIASSMFADTAINLNSKKIMSIIDLDLCDGCENLGIPACVNACKIKNANRFPVPKQPVMDYWPQKKHEDYSNQKDNISRLTPYNFTFIQSVEIGNKKVFVPRRCMHCDNPPCQKLCPFGVISKSDEGAVDIDEKFCFGGAKCRDICPWGIPQRQGGVGLYLKVAPKFAGGGAMFKCDMCADLLAKGEKPVCQKACPKRAIKFAPKDEIMALLKNEKREIYGLNENGGTSTIYLSSVKFEAINEALNKKFEGKNRMGNPHLKRVRNPLENSQMLATATLIAPLAGAMAAGITVYKNIKKDAK
nr:4Fe-4S dicluster domain-containing protein [Campylobacter sp.]